MKENVSHTLVGQKTRIYAILFLFLFLSFAAVSGWLFFSMSRAESPDPLLVAMSVIVTVVAAVFLLVTILCFSQNDGIYLTNAGVRCIICISYMRRSSAQRFAAAFVCLLEKELL